jgi:hypothetical protein
MRYDSRARRGLRALVTAVVVSLALGGLLAGGAAAAPPTAMQRAQRGAQWLANQIRANKGFVTSFGVADPTDTAYAVIALRAAGVDRPAANLAMKYLDTKTGSALRLDGHDSPGALADFIMAAVADGQDPRHFNGTGVTNNLVNRLLATERRTGKDAGLFGVQDPTYDGAFREGLALAALKGANVPVTDPHLAQAFTWLSKQQCANGLWEAYRANVATPCPAANPNTFTGPDTNSTALAVQGLAAWGRRPRQATVVNSLHVIQSSDAGFGFVAAPNQASDPDSTALVIQALLAENSPPTATMWRKGAHSPFTALASYQLGCAQTGYGAFFFPPSTSANVFATVQAVPAMASKTLPVAPTTASVTVSLTPC